MYRKKASGLDDRCHITQVICGVGIQKQCFPSIFQEAAAWPKPSVTGYLKRHLQPWLEKTQARLFRRPERREPRCCRPCRASRVPSRTRGSGRRG